MTGKFEWYDAEVEVPVNDKYVMIHFSNFDLPIVGRYEGNEEEGFAWYIGDEEESCTSQDLHVDYWMPLDMITDCFNRKGE